jgi:extradiol dioxygenase family protein
MNEGQAVDAERDWPLPEVPYREAVRFGGREGQRIVDGKVYYPTHLRLSLDEQEAWRVVRELLHQLECRYETTKEITLSGQLTKQESEE